MKKEEILEKSRKENKMKDVYAVQVENDATKYAAIAMVLLAFIYFTYEIVIGKGQNLALYSILTLYNTVFYGFKAIKIEKDRTLNSVTSIIWAILTIGLIVGYFMGE